METIRTAPPMTRAEWEALPPEVKRFVTWKDAQQGKIVFPRDTSETGLNYFSGKSPLVLPKA